MNARDGVCPLTSYCALSEMSNRERRRRRRQQSDHLLVFGASADPKAEPALLAAYPPSLALPPSIATFCFPSGALPPAEQGAPRFSCNVVSTPSKRVHICCLAFREPTPSADTTEGALKCLCVLSSSERIFQLRSYLHGLHRLFMGDAAAIAAQPRPEVCAAPATAEQRHSGESGVGGSGTDAQRHSGESSGSGTDARSRRQARRQRSESDETGAASQSNEGVVFEAWLLERLRAGQADILPPSAAAAPPAVPDADADATSGEGAPAGSAWEEWCCAALLQLAGPELLSELLGAAVQERSILLVADDSLSLTAASVALCSLLSPLSWQGSFLPVLPRRLREELLQAPVPYIFGLPSGALDAADLARTSPHLVCVDVSARKLLFPPSPAAPPLPAALRRPLLAQLAAAAELSPPPPPLPDGAPARLQLPSDPEGGEAGGGWRGAGAAVRGACMAAVRELAGAAWECARLGGGMDGASRAQVAARWAAPKERAFVLALLESQQASALVEPLLAAQEDESAAAATLAASAATGGAGSVAVAAAPTPAAPTRALSMRAVALASRLAVGMQQVKASAAAAASVADMAEGGGGSSVVRLHAAWSEARQELLERDGSARAGHVLQQLDADIERLCCESEAAQLAPTQSPPP